MQEDTQVLDDGRVQFNAVPKLGQTSAAQAKTLPCTARCWPMARA